MGGLHQSCVEGYELVNRGKVRDLYRVDDDHLLMVATDRISAFDVILNDPVPGKGIILTQLSLFWFNLLKDIAKGHVVGSERDDMPMALQKQWDQLRGRSLLVRAAKVFPAECVARGYLLGSGHKDYLATGEICGISLPKGLTKNSPFTPPIFTPATKAEAGEHDENISFEQLAGIVGSSTAAELRALTMEVFQAARAYAAERGVIICDTKFEWGMIDGAIALVDEVLTPDSSRFWRKEEADAMLPDAAPPSFDKQVVRDYLETLDWDKTAPGPAIPEEVMDTAKQRYVEIYERISGQAVPYLDE